MTGGAGLVGATVTRVLLERGDRVVVLDSGIAAGFASLEETAVTLVKGDMRARAAVEQAMDGCEAVVHLAAQASVPASIEQPLDDFSINLGGSLEILEAARRRGVRRFVFASSSSVVAGHPPPTHEGLLPYPVSPYGAAKAAVEAYLRAYAEAYGLVGVALRFSNAYGPWAAHKSSVAASFIRAFLAGGPLVVRGGGHQTRDFVHVSDLAAAIVAALDAPPENVRGEVFQIGTGRETSLLDLADLLFEVGDHQVAIEHQPPASFSSVARCGATQTAPGSPAR